MKLIGNIIWCISGGLITAILWLVCGVLLCLSVIGVPFGVQCFKFARLSFMPFGKRVQLDFSRHPIMNMIWLVLFGWEIALVYFFVACLCFISIFGISKGIQLLKFSKLAFAPFGARIK